MEKKKSKVNKKNYYKHVFLITFLVTVIIGMVFLIISMLNEKEASTPLEKIQETFKEETVINTEPIVLVDYSGLSSEEIVEKSTTGVDNFTYSLYCRVDADWVQEISDEDKELLTIMGGNIEGLNFYEIALVSGMVTKDYEYFNYLDTIYNLGATTLNNTQQYFDYNENKVYYTSTQNIEDTDLEWTVEESDSIQIEFEDFLNDISVKETTEDEKTYYISGELQIDNQKSNNLNWLYYNLCNVTDADIRTQIPITLEISKETGYLSKIHYDLSIFKDLALTETYKITNVEMYYSFVGINETELEIPKEVKKNFNLVSNEEKTIEMTPLSDKQVEFINNITFKGTDNIDYTKVVLLPDIVNAEIPLQQEYWGTLDLIMQEDFINMFNGWTINRYSDLLVTDMKSSIYLDITSGIIDTMLTAIGTYSEEDLMGYILTELKYDTPLDIKQTCGYALLSKIGFGEYNEQYFNMYNNTGKTVDMIVQDVRLLK